MKYYIIAGEASGDLHAANLMKAIVAEDPQADFRFWGGDLMKKVGGTLVKHYRDLAFMGFLEVLMNLRTITKNLAFCKKDIARFAPDVIIYIDYPGFNMRIAKWARQEGYKNHYYISPQIWAWKEGRIKAIKKDVDEMYVILPFEKAFYEEKHNFPVHFVGHPLIDEISARTPVVPENFRKEHQLDDRPIIALLPGSRKQEIQKMLEIMLSITSDFPDHQFVIAGAPSQDLEFYEPFLKKNRIHIVMNQTYNLLDVAHAALVTSGTATLETALFKVPEVVCYKGGRISYEIAKRVINLDYISLVNLIMDKEVVKELIQTEFNTKTLKKALTEILEEEKRKALFDEYYKLEQKLGGVGASANTAKLIVNAIQSTSTPV
ncbi:lipid-A-disaccharide synthase [Leeuwenhoekiella blandensis]|uniref:Lipid-A-disaccharide synthase n=1 Tax=Leeuwenhoekiella blandensis (strain CECT 7118 / CCUG 51940 / KCTC 22103 / MED217) TaxID=398720 RepID=A3XQU1_LEEBM|nr:lipid-A-disaccharide synthase [Leeuwenhoekiella blandensis]EAQ48035.1 lipid-A-disaccharide synthase [Leeuwenhoekiella blandensis MED217]